MTLLISSAAASFNLEPGEFLCGFCNDINIRPMCERCINNSWFMNDRECKCRNPVHLPSPEQQMTKMMLEAGKTEDEIVAMGLPLPPAPPEPPPATVAIQENLEQRWVIQQPVDAKFPLPPDRPTEGRGALEGKVHAVCVDWVTGILYGGEGDGITVKVACTQLDRGSYSGTTSSGAVQKVWERWTQLGYATMANKPIRFTGFTPDAIKYGLDTIIKKARR